MTFTVLVNNAPVTVEASIDRLRPGDYGFAVGTHNIVIEQVLPEEYDIEETRQQVIEQLTSP